MLIFHTLLFVSTLHIKVLMVVYHIHFKNYKEVIRMNKWNKVADNQTLEKTAAALENNNITTIIVNNGRQAKQKVLKLLSKGAEVKDATSITLDTIGKTKEIQESGNYKSVKKQLMSM